MTAISYSPYWVLRIKSPEWACKLHLWAGWSVRDVEPDKESKFLPHYETLNFASKAPDHDPLSLRVDA
jgi:hypothetical protein